MAQSEDSPIAMKLKKICLKTPVGEEQAAQAVLDPALGESELASPDVTWHNTVTLCHVCVSWSRQANDTLYT